VAVKINQTAIAQYYSGDYDAAVETARQVIRSYPDYPLAYRWLAAALGQLGRTEEAREALEKAMAVAPASFDIYVRNRVPWMRPEDHAQSGLGQANGSADDADSIRGVGGSRRQRCRDDCYASPCLDR
jgi:adenylate cyclase